MKCWSFTFRYDGINTLHLSMNAVIKPEGGAPGWLS